MYLFVEVIFYSGHRKHLPVKGYRPDAVFNDARDYWGITFIELSMEGAKQVGVGKIISLEYD